MGFSATLLVGLTWLLLWLLSLKWSAWKPLLNGYTLVLRACAIVTLYLVYYSLCIFSRVANRLGRTVLKCWDSIGSPLQVGGQPSQVALEPPEPEDPSFSRRVSCALPLKKAKCLSQLLYLKRGWEHSSSGVVTLPESNPAWLTSANLQATAPP
jgi:hypothetical protein